MSSPALLIDAIGAKLTLLRLWAFIYIISLFGLLCAGCSRQSETALDLTAYNHTDQGIGWYSVSSNGKSGGAGFLDAGAGGGGYSCCVSVPSIWKPGITISVTSDAIVNGVEKIVTRSVLVPEYDAKTASTLNVHFLRDGRVKVFVTRIMLGHRDYPLKGKEAELKPGIPIKIIWP